MPTPAPAKRVILKAQVSGYTVTTFGAAAQLAYRGSIAKRAGVRIARVALKNIAAASRALRLRRRLLRAEAANPIPVRWLGTSDAIRFDIEIAADTTGQASAVENSLATWTPAQAKVAFTAELQAASLTVPPGLDVVQVTAPQIIDAGSVRDTSDDGNTTSSAAVAGGASAAVCLLVVVIALVARRRKQNHTRAPRPIAGQGSGSAADTQTPGARDGTVIKQGSDGSWFVQQEGSGETDNVVVRTPGGANPRSCDL